MDRAFEVYKQMRESRVRGTPECYTAAVHACSPTGDLDLALSVFEDMRNDGVKPDAVRPLVI
jgi:pentatricopeptide repeat protein